MQTKECCKNPFGSCPLLLPDGTCPLPRETDGSLYGIAFDHVVPHADGGATTVANAQVLCTICHAKKTRGEARKRKP
jgi:5-methylcytosine-specific restriction endonuclease McrA